MLVLLTSALPGCGGVVIDDDHDDDLGMHDDPIAGPPIACPAGAQMFVHKRFRHEHEDGWDSEWVPSGDGQASVRDHSGLLSADPDGISRLTLNAPLQTTDVRLRLRFAHDARQTIVLGLFGSPAEAAPPFGDEGLDLRLSHRPDDAHRVRWSIHSGESLIGLESPQLDARDADESFWIRAHIDRGEETAYVAVEAWSARDPEPDEWRQITLRDVQESGELRLAAITHADARARQTVRIEELLVCIDR